MLHYTVKVFNLIQRGLIRKYAYCALRYTGIIFYFRLIFSMFPIRISAGTQNKLTQAFRGLTQYLQENAE
jgi:hypothetical protein